MLQLHIAPYSNLVNQMRPMQWCLLVAVFAAISFFIISYHTLKRCGICFILGIQSHVVATPTSSDLTIAIGSSQLLCKLKKKDAVIAAVEGPSSSFSSSSDHHLSLSLSEILQPKLPRPKRCIYITEISLSLTATAPSHENCKSKFADR